MCAGKGDEDVIVPVWTAHRPAPLSSGLRTEDRESPHNRRQGCVAHGPDQD